MDGRSITGDTDVRRHDNAARKYVFLSENARLGKRFRELPSAKQDIVRKLNTNLRAADRILAKALKDAMKEFDLDGLANWKARATKLLREHGIGDEFIKLAVSDDRGAEKEQLVERIKSHVYEISNRIERSDEIIVQVTFIAKDTGATMYDL